MALELEQIGAIYRLHVVVRVVFDGRSNNGRVCMCGGVQ